MASAYESCTQDRAVVERASVELASATPREVLQWALMTYGDGLCVAASLTDAVLIDMASKLRPGIHVLFADTGFHFAETLRTRDELSRRYAVTLVTVQSPLDFPRQAEPTGSKQPIYTSDPDLCCWLNKVEPLNTALRDYRAWASGIRRDEGQTRAQVEPIEWDGARAMVKVNPLANWTKADVDFYVSENDILVNPLVAAGYPSIGCAPCTSRATNGGGDRSGRWAGRDKVECGLHSR